MITNLQSIIVNKPIPGLTGMTFNKCTTLADVLAALAASAGAADIYAVSGAYDATTQNLVITLSNGSTFNIPAALLLPVLADGATITGNGTNGNPLVGYQILYDATSRAMTILPPTSGPIIIPAQTATTEAATDVGGVLGVPGATVTTQQLLDALAAASHSPATLDESSNPALTVDSATQLVKLNLSASGSYDNSTSGLDADNVQTAINELAHHLRDCCDSGVQEIPASAFADPLHPADAELAAWVAANGPFGPNTLLVYPNEGTIADPDWVWEIDRSGNIINLETLQLAATEPAIDTENLLGNGAGSATTTQQLLDFLAHHLTACCPSPTLEIPASVFADPLNPTEIEAQAWIDSQAPLKPGTQIIYNRFVNGDVEDPDYVWLVNEIGDATNIESPADAGTHALPVAAFTRTSKLGLTAAFHAAASNGVTYAWTAAPRTGTTGVVTLATPSAVTTAATFSTPGQYDVTLTVTDAQGNTASATQTLAVARVLEIVSPNADSNDYLPTLQAAYDWINVHDAANASSYLLEICGVTADSGTLTPNTAKVHFKEGGHLPANVTLSSAGVYHWSGASRNRKHIAGDFTVPAGVNPTLSLDQLFVNRFTLQSGIITLNRCKAENNTSYAAYFGGAGTVLTGSDFEARATGAAGQGITGGYGLTLDITNFRAYSNRSNGIDFYNGVSGVMQDCVGVCQNGVNVFHGIAIAPPAATAPPLLVQDCRGETYAPSTTSKASGLYLTPNSGYTGDGKVTVVGGRFFSSTGVGIRSNIQQATPQLEILHVASEGPIALQRDNANNPVAWNPAPIYNSVFKGTLVGPITFPANADNVNY